MRPRSLGFQFLCLCVILWSSSDSVRAYNPPVDTAGSLTIRIESPEIIEDPEAATPIAVVVENASDTKLDGAFTLKMIDRWRVCDTEDRPIEGPQNFSVQAKGSQRLEYHITADAPTYNAHYPIHVLAQWNEPNATDHASPEVAFTAHPIAIFIVQQSRPPFVESQEIPWQPAVLASHSRVALTELAATRVGFGVYSQDPDRVTLEAIGWFGNNLDHRGFVQREPAALQGGSYDCFVSHIPWGGGPGFSIVEIPLTFPQEGPITLDFSNGIQKQPESGDGMTFRIRVLPFDAPDGQIGEIAWETHIPGTGSWTHASADLSKYAGQTVRIQLEWNPGPAKNTSFDLGYWGGPILTCGTPETIADERSITSDADREPMTLTAGKNATLTIAPGARGLLDATYQLSTLDSVRQTPASPAIWRGIQVQTLGTRVDLATSGITLHKVTKEPLESDSQSSSQSGIAYRHTFESTTEGTFDLVVAITPAQTVSTTGELTGESRVGEPQEAFRVDVKLENAPQPKPWRIVRLENVAMGEWDHTLEYLHAGVGNVVEHPGAFRLGFDGHQLASSYVGLTFAAERLPGAVAPEAIPENAVISVVQGTLNTPDAFQSSPDPKHYSIHTGSTTCVTFYAIPCEQIFDGVKVWRQVCGKGKSPDADQLAGKFVFDLWGGKYAETATQLNRAFQYGLTDSVVVFHNWQRWGYDYRLPEIYPPNPQLGTLEEMRALRDLCVKNDVVFAPHDNYVDIYPDADTFSYEEAVAFNPNRTPYPAWLNEGRGARSYRYRADAIKRIAYPNIDKIQSGLAPTGYFIDVWSSLGAYDFYTSDGTFYDRTYTNQVWGDTFNHIREVFRGNNGKTGVGSGAPQISESGHDGLVGTLDGAQTNHLRAEHPETATGWSIWNIPHGDAERTPWLDSAYHDRFILHGAGYPGRYEGGLPASEHSVYSDDYICTEILDGHPSMVSQAFHRDVVRKNWLITPIARALANATIESILYHEGDIHRQIVTWKTVAGETITVYVNRGTTDWELPIAGPSGPQETLPPFGFFAEGNGVSAGITRDPQTGLIREFAYRVDVNKDQSNFDLDLYCNGRYPVGYQPIRCTLDSLEFSAENPRQFSGVLRWETASPIPPAFRLFLHVVDPDGEDEGIVSQAGGEQPVTIQTDSGAQALTTTFRGTLPEDVAKSIAAGKSIELRGGLFRPDTGQRLDIVGPQDTTRRWRWLTFTPAERSSTFTYTPMEAPNDVQMERLNLDKIPLSFDVIHTAYGCRVHVNGARKTTEIIPLPASNGATGVTFEAQLAWQSGRQLTAYDFDGKEIETASHLSDDGTTMSLIGTSEVFRFVVEEK